MAVGAATASERQFVIQHGKSPMAVDDHDVWLQEANKLLSGARHDPTTLAPALRQLCKRAFRDFRFAPSIILDYMAVSSPGLFEEAGFSDAEIDELMPTIDRIIGEEWSARQPGWPAAGADLSGRMLFVDEHRECAAPRNSPMDRPRAFLTVVAGRPGSGKTTLAHALARAIRCPAICRDEIKEGLVNSLTPGAAAMPDDMQRRANRAFFATVELLLQHGVTLVAEAAFQHKLWAAGLEPLLAIEVTRIVVCNIDPELAASRHIERGLADPAREHFHGDHAVQAAREGQRLPISSYDPPTFDVPTLLVDTTEGYHPPLESIVRFARGDAAPAAR
jgi:predicted kinase